MRYPLLVFTLFDFLRVRAFECNLVCFLNHTIIIKRKSEILHINAIIVTDSELCILILKMEIDYPLLK